MTTKQLPYGVSIILLRDGKVAVSQRISKDGQLGLWQFPGGHVEAEEAPLDGAIRELREETGLVLPAHRFLLLGSPGELAGYNGQPYIGLRFGVVLGAGEEPQCTEPEKNTAWAWVRADAIMPLKMLQATKEYALAFAFLHVVQERDRFSKALKEQADHWQEIEAIAKEFGIWPDISLASENLTDGRWSYNDPCSGKLFREDEVVDEILRCIAELKKKETP